MYLQIRKKHQQSNKQNDISCGRRLRYCLLMYVLEWWTVSVLKRNFFINNKHKNNTQASTNNSSWECIHYLISYTTWKIRKWWQKWRSLHIVPVSHLLILRSADDVTIDCWWHHNNWDNCDSITWIVISNLLDIDIDFIHDDIHGWLCKKTFFL